MRNRFFLNASFKQLTLALPLLFWCRKHHFSFLFIVNQAFCDNNIRSKSVLNPPAKTLVTKMGDSSASKNNGNGLLLYYNKYSFYSQKVVIALHEKKLSFEPHSIDLTKGEQYKQWFLQINPRGEVPVLQDTGKIIPDSGRIIDYLEDNFSNGDTPRLIPMDLAPETRQKITYFRNLIDKINGNVLTTGSILHPELATGKKKIPFIAPVRRQLVNNEKHGSENLRKLADQYPEAKDMLLEKAIKHESNYEKLLNKEEFLNILKEVDDLFDQVEQELNLHSEDRKNWWLCSDRFTVADVCLTTLLIRINQIGMEPRFWTNGKRPHIEEYFRRIKERDSYKKTVPTTFDFVKTIFFSQAPFFLGVSVATVVAIIVGGYFVVKKVIYK